MAQFRAVKCKIWSDNWYTELTSEEKLLWLFLLTNQYVTSAGIYEIPRLWIPALSGIQDAEIILEKFIQEGKIEYKEGWMFIRNFLAHQNLSSISPEKDNVVKGIVRFLAENPKLIALFNLTEEAPYKPLLRVLGEASDTLGSSSSASSRATSSSTPRRKPLTSDPVDQVILVFKTSINPTIDFDDQVQRRVTTDLINEFGVKEVLAAAEKAVAVQGEEYAPQIVSPKDLKEKLAKLKVHLRRGNKK